MLPSWMRRSRRFSLLTVQLKLMQRIRHTTKYHSISRMNGATWSRGGVQRGHRDPDSA